jgi:hypothetical protein
VGKIYIINFQSLPLFNVIMQEFFFFFFRNKYFYLFSFGLESIIICFVLYEVNYYSFKKKISI